MEDKLIWIFLNKDEIRIIETKNKNNWIFFGFEKSIS